jgi:hypothetical protein
VTGRRRCIGHGADAKDALPKLREMLAKFDTKAAKKGSEAQTIKTAIDRISAVGLRSGDPAAERVDALVVAAQERFHRGAIAGLRRGHELAVVGDSRDGRTVASRRAQAAGAAEEGWCGRVLRRLSRRSPRR